ncbi:MAG: uncharacterized membrane protein YbhN (UPF0104 family) [Acidimicrobiales bacterium]
MQGPFLRLAIVGTLMPAISLLLLALVLGKPTVVLAVGAGLDRVPFLGKGWPSRTPGGLGVLEVGLAGSLGFGGDADSSQILAAVLVFRALTYLLPIPLGVVSLVAARPQA